LSLRCCFALLLGLALALAASAATTSVNSLSALQTAINSAVAGDEIVVQNGTYTSTAAITINRVGEPGSPILIRAESVGGVTIGGSAGFRFASPAGYVTVQGFVFTHAGSINMPSGTHHLRLTRNVIQLTIPAGSDVSYVNISGNDIEIDYNELRNKTTLGNMLDITGSGSQVARRLWVHHNYFHDFTSPGGNGAETVRWGLSGLSLSTGDGLCEYNLFVRCTGENEMISNKSSGNTFRYNTVLDSPGGEISQRHGDNCYYYGNYMRNTSGIRIYGDNHQVFSNYIVNSSKGIDMGNGDGDVRAGSPLTAHDRPDNCVVVFNTLINNNVHYQMGGRTNGLGATNTTFANNIMQGGTTSVSISGSAPYTNPVWGGNIVWNVTNGGGSSMPAGTYTIVNPMLVVDANGIFHLDASSPAIDAAVGTYPEVTADQDGQPRPETGKDIGADEVSSAAITARILTPADVGPTAGLILPPAAPTFSLPSDVYSGPQSISLATVTPGASIRYTTDGSTPSEAVGILYTGPITISETTTLRAIAFAPGVPNSPVSTATYTITSEPPVATRRDDPLHRGRQCSFADQRHDLLRSDHGELQRDAPCRRLCARLADQRDRERDL
jgi:poly(beta-D-mannuronate) lyase